MSPLSVEITTKHSSRLEVLTLFSAGFQQKVQSPDFVTERSPGAADLPAQQDRLYWPQLSRPCGRKQDGDSQGTGNFFKVHHVARGANDSLVIPKNGTKVDWEVELAVIIGKKALYVSTDEAIDHVAGYALHNDYSERSFQLERGGQWVKGKSADSFAPLGPFLATQTEIPDPGNLQVWLKVNGVFRQKSSTADMIFDVPTLVSYVSQFMTLLPGDVISTGTPAGVGLGMTPPQYLKVGDIVELGIERLGESRQLAVNFSEEQYNSTVV